MDAVFASLALDCVRSCIADLDATRNRFSPAREGGYMVHVMWVINVLFFFLAPFSGGRFGELIDFV
jgi:hypothetical protein